MEIHDVDYAECYHLVGDRPKHLRRVGTAASKRRRWPDEFRLVLHPCLARQLGNAISAVVMRQEAFPLSRPSKLPWGLWIFCRINLWSQPTSRSRVRPRSESVR